MSAYDNLGDDYVGDDEDYVGDEEVLGATRPPARGGRQMVRRAAGPQLVARNVQPQLIGGYLGFGVATFVAGGLTTLEVEVEPQRGFRPERLVIIRRDGSTATAGLQVTLKSVTIGDMPQSPTSQGAPVEMFAPDATYAKVTFNKAQTGQKIKLIYEISALPAGTELVRISAGMYGDMMR